MSEVLSPSTGRRYSIKRVCKVWQIPRSTVHSQLRRSSVTDLRHPGSEARSERVPMRNWSPSFSRRSTRHPSTAKDTARSGPGFAFTVCGRQRIGSAG